MTSFAFVARIGAVAPPVPFGSGQGPQPLLGDDTRRKNYAALNKEEADRERTIFVLPLAEAGRSQHRIRLDVGLCRRPDFCCLRGAAPHPVLS